MTKKQVRPKRTKIKGRKLYRFWCIAKKAKVMAEPNPESEVLAEIPFGKMVLHTVNKNTEVPGWMLVTDQYPQNKFFKRPLVKGWVMTAGFVNTEVIDYAKLNFQCVNDKCVPVSLRYRGKVHGRIMPGEKVQMIAVVGDWCLTNRGWSKFKWFEKIRDIYDDELVGLVFHQALGQAYRDYEHAIKRVVSGKMKDQDAINQTFYTIREVERWIKGSKWEPLFEELLEELTKDVVNEFMPPHVWIESREATLTSRSVKGWRV